MTTLDDVAALAAREHGLVVVATTRGDGTVQASVVNAGIVEHPVTGGPVVAFVTYGRAKLANLRERPVAAVTFRVGWEWATVEGGAEIVGPDDPRTGFDPAALASLLREVFDLLAFKHAPVADEGDLVDAKPGFDLVDLRRKGLRILRIAGKYFDRDRMTYLVAE